MLRFLFYVLSLLLINFKKMNKISFILIFIPGLIFSQEVNNGIKLNQTIDTTYVYIARDLGLCYNGKKTKNK